jgi:hypothetical protein
VVNVFHRQIGGFIFAELRGKYPPKKMFGREVKHFHPGNVQVLENVPDGDELQAMPFERAALWTDGMLSDTGKTA